ncbi:hypothetical protein [Geomonas limicola]|uniref:hypothetical protein n=1 Tax=Geomonas limicola TaxID=2740186 RepID=UPI0016198DAE|nr:hypothetical protein [Geomonas limicola]
MNELRKEWIVKLKELGLEVVSDAEMERVFVKHRIRYTGGVDTATAQAFRKDVEADAILVTSLESISDLPPKLSMMSRLVSTEEKPRIFWMNSATLAGDDAPGLLGLGLVTDFKVVQEKVLRRLASSLRLYLEDDPRQCSFGSFESKFEPKTIARPTPAGQEKRTSIAVVPFYNESFRKSGGMLLQLHFVNQLACYAKVDVVEPGLVREKMLSIRMVMREGISTRDVDVMSYILESDYVLSGTVFDYQDTSGGGGTPKVDFNALLADKINRKLVFASKSYNQGDDGVFFYDVGLYKNVAVMTEKMTGNVVNEMRLGERKTKSDRPSY